MLAGSVSPRSRTRPSPPVLLKASFGLTFGFDARAAPPANSSPADRPILAHGCAFMNRAKEKRAGLRRPEA
jgi:hypothetical protein